MIDKKTAAILHRTDDLWADAGRHGRASLAGADGAKIGHELWVDIGRAV